MVGTKLIEIFSPRQRWARRWRGEKISISFVPTMGYLHAGHAALIQRARRKAGKTGRVVVSIYVNPAQFAPHEDLARYPRDLRRDKILCRQAGVDVLFVPDDSEMYPEPFSTFVVEEKLSRPLEGAARPTHFRGVATVVAKLFNIVLPDTAVFGAKDFQQTAVVRRLARDLNFPVKIIVAATVREADGLALSSRNKYLSPAQRRQATVLWRALRSARAATRRRSVDSRQLKKNMARLIAHEPEARLDYVEFF